MCTCPGFRVASVGDAGGGEVRPKLPDDDGDVGRATLDRGHPRRVAPAIGDDDLVGEPVGACVAATRP